MKPSTPSKLLNHIEREGALEKLWIFLIRLHLAGEITLTIESRVLRRLAKAEKQARWEAAVWERGSRDASGRNDRMSEWRRKNAVDAKESRALARDIRALRLYLKGGLK